MDKIPNPESASLSEDNFYSVIENIEIDESETNTVKQVQQVNQLPQIQQIPQPLVQQRQSIQLQETKRKYLSLKHPVGICLLILSCILFLIIIGLSFSALIYGSVILTYIHNSDLDKTNKYVTVIIGTSCTLITFNITNVFLVLHKLLNNNNKYSIYRAISIGIFIMSGISTIVFTVIAGREKGNDNILPEEKEKLFGFYISGLVWCWLHFCCSGGGIFCDKEDS